MEKNATRRMTKKELLLGIYFTFSLLIACVEVTSDSFMFFIGYYTIALLNLGNCVRVINAHEKKAKEKWEYNCRKQNLNIGRLYRRPPNWVQRKHCKTPG